MEQQKEKQQGVAQDLILMVEQKGLTMEDAIKVLQERGEVKED